MNMKTCKLLFQGDSITDADRVRENPLDLGTGYPYYAAQLLRAQHPDVDFTFWNRGIGCDETQHLLARIEPDLIALQPDVVSLLIGINDTWHHADARDWMPLSVFEARYRAAYRGHQADSAHDAANSKVLQRNEGAWASAAVGKHGRFESQQQDHPRVAHDAAAMLGAGGDGATDSL